LREISPAVDASADEYLAHLPPSMKEIVLQIRQEKAAGTRPNPSAFLLDRSSLLTDALRRSLIDKVASLVDENLSGRSDMCLQFAQLLSNALVHMKFSARPVLGTAIYYDNRARELFRWSHAWVRVGQEVIDGNVDCLSENPLVPDSVQVLPYWGLIRETPADRMLREKSRENLNPDSDVRDIWWPELRAWLDESVSGFSGA